MQLQHMMNTSQNGSKINKNGICRRSEELRVICYQDPKTSNSKVHCCLYKDALNRNGVFSKEKEKIKQIGCKLGIFYKTNNNKTS